MNERVIYAMVYLLQESDVRNEEILRYLVTACSYISLNFKFVNSQLSIRILQALVPILVRLLSQPSMSKNSNINSPVNLNETIKSSSYGGYNAASPLSSPADSYLE